MKVYCKTSKEKVMAMLAGHVLQRDNGTIMFLDWNRDGGPFVCMTASGMVRSIDGAWHLDSFYYEAPARKVQTQWDALTWAKSEKAEGKIVRERGGRNSWWLPESMPYAPENVDYEVATLTTEGPKDIHPLTEEEMPE